MANSAFHRLKMDAARWVSPSQIVPVERITWPVLVNLLRLHTGLRAMAWLRFAEWLIERRVRGVRGLIQRHIHRAYGLEFVVGAPIGGGLYIAHTTGTVLAPHAMGENCSVIANVTVGMRNEHRFPIIGDRVFLGAGARVLGGITIGADAQIGANAVVLKDVPAAATAVGVPARILQKDAATVSAHANVADVSLLAEPAAHGV